MNILIKFRSTIPGDIKIMLVLLIPPLSTANAACAQLIDQLAHFDFSNSSFEQNSQFLGQSSVVSECVIRYDCDDVTTALGGGPTSPWPIITHEMTHSLPFRSLRFFCSHHERKQLEERKRNYCAIFRRLYKWSHSSSLLADSMIHDFLD